MSFQDNLAAMPAIDHLSGRYSRQRRAMWFITFPMHQQSKARSSFTMLWRKSLAVNLTAAAETRPGMVLPNMLPIPKPIRTQTSEY